MFIVINNKGRCLFRNADGYVDTSVELATTFLSRRRAKKAINDCV